MSLYYWLKKIKNMSFDVYILLPITEKRKIFNEYSKARNDYFESNR